MGDQDKRHEGIVIACLVVVVIMVIAGFILSKVADEPLQWDKPSMVFIDSQLYMIDTLYYVKTPADMQYLGRIKSTVDSTEIPSEEFQSNDEILGHEVYKRDGYLIIPINGRFCVYKPYGEQ